MGLKRAERGDSVLGDVQARRDRVRLAVSFVENGETLQAMSVPVRQEQLASAMRASDERGDRAMRGATQETRE